MSRHQRRRQSLLRPRRLAAPPLRVFLPVTVLVTLLALMVLRGMANNEVFHDEKVAVSVDKGTVPKSVLEGGPVVDSRGSRQDHPVSYTVPDKTVVLTFDDGPSSEWTPKILDVLAKQHIKADFFVTGSMTTRSPALIRRIVAEGHEIGLHTYTHPDLALHDNIRLNWELGETQLALAGVAGIHSSLFRPPYSSTADALDDWSWPVTKKVGANGYLVAFIDKDTDDWKRPGVNAIVQAAMPALPGQGEMILLHDAGGNRAQTLTALPIIIEKLKAQGYTFKTIGEALGAGPANTEVSGSTLWAGKAFVWATTFSVGLMPWLVVLLAVVGVLVFTRFALMLVLSLVHVRRTRKAGFSWGHRSPSRSA